MANGRWYPSAVELGNGSVLAASGYNGTNGQLVQNAELFDPSARTWSQVSGLTYLPSYPSLTLLADGRLFYSGQAAGGSSVHAPGVWNPFTNAWVNAPSPQDPTRRDYGSSVLLPPAQAQRIAVFGGGTTGNTSITAVADADVYDLSNPGAPVHSTGLPMRAPKIHVMGVILPDETVFETGGGLTFAAEPVQEAAIYQPSNGMWSGMNAPSVPRTYHSEAILLPDGRVATLGSNSSGYQPETRIEVFSPPYLFKGQRPAIASAPTEASYGTTFPVAVTAAPGSALGRLVLIKPASVTHSVDPNQRLVELPFTAAPGGFAATLPANPNLTPPGWYMMFAVDNQGRPSVAHWLHVS
jgi:hypothetical protein